MEAFLPLLALCEGNSLVTGEFPSQRPVTQSFGVFFDPWTNGWVNNQDACDLRRHRAHYDVIVVVNKSHESIRNSRSNNSKTKHNIHNLLHTK